MPETATRPLPSIRFEPRPARPADALPRMDVAVFVGFAASGPLHTPVAVDSPAQFQAIFGDDAPLAWNAERGETTSAQLGASVRAFFSNGGRHCWIVRVAADEARSDHFPLPGLLCARFVAHGSVLTIPAFARARAKGSWADQLRVSTALQRHPLQPAAPYDGGDALWLSQSVAGAPAAGDVMRIEVNGGEQVVFARVEEAEPQPGSPSSAPLRVTLGPRVTFAQVAAMSPGITISTRAWIYSQETGVDDGALASASPSSGFETEVSAQLQFPDGPAGRVTLVLDVAPALAPAPGALLRIELGETPCWVLVTSLGLASGAEAARAVRVEGQGWTLAVAPVITGEASITAELVTLDLRVAQGENATYTLRGLGLAAGHPRYWNLLRVDEQFFGDPETTPQADSMQPDFELADLRQAAAPNVVRFPLAGTGENDLLFCPLAVPTLFAEPAGPLLQSGTRLERDGLREFRADLFLDPDLSQASVDALLPQADFLRYLAPKPRPLRGIHSALGYLESPIIEEATLIAVPDAVHRRWRETSAEWSPPSARNEIIPPPDWWHLGPCAPSVQTSPDTGVDRSQFRDCLAREIAAPQDLKKIPSDGSATFLLTWSSRESGSEFTLEEANFPDFSDAHTVYSGSETSLTLYGRSAGDYYYRVRASVGRNGSQWSAPLAFRIGQSADARLERAAEYDDQTLLAIHRALLRMCAGRGDLFAVLSLPAHYREQDAVAHTAALATLAETQSAPSAVQPLGRRESRALSHGALYHPWTLTRLPGGEIAPIAPDGPAMGVLAARAAVRGAWIAPANEPMSEIVGLSPPVRREQWQALQDAQVNLVRQEPRGFMCLSADTLSRDADLRPIGVRRLLILLRRLALRRGAAYVFEPLSNAFRRLVQRGFEAALLDLFQRGAFAGTTPATSFQVVTGDPLNTPQDRDNGRFLVELRVAPSLPMRFLSIRLLQAGDQLAVIEGR